MTLLLADQGRYRHTRCALAICVRQRKDLDRDNLGAGRDPGQRPQGCLGAPFARDDAGDMGAMPAAFDERRAVPRRIARRRGRHPTGTQRLETATPGITGFRHHLPRQERMVLEDAGIQHGHHLPGPGVALRMGHIRSDQRNALVQHRREQHIFFDGRHLRVRPQRVQLGGVHRQGKIREWSQNG